MKIKRLGILIGVIAFSIYLVGGAMISFLAIRSSLDEAMTEHNSIVSTLVADIVSEPLKLGSFVEARVRIQSFIKKGIFQCADLYYDGMPISKCETPEGLKSISTVLNISAENIHSNPVLVTYIDESVLRGVAFKKALGVVGFVFTFGLIFLVGIVALLQRIGTEIVAVSDEILGAASRETQNSPIFEINFLKAKMKEYVSLKNSEIESQAMLKVSRQVAHDIRSPLSALEMALKTADLPPERQEILNQVAKRIRSIADDLLKRSKGVQVRAAEKPTDDCEKVETFEAVPSVLAILEEKRTSYPTVLIQADGLPGSVQIPGEAGEFERVLSNLLQNAIEAVSDVHDPRVTFAIRKYSSQIQLSILDNGKGIPSEILSRISEEGFSYDKAHGNGLGVSSAKRKVAEWGGKLEIQSRLGMGTMVTLQFNTGVQLAASV